jgi:chaperonin cofactor prefoldin
LSDKVGQNPTWAWLVGVLLVFCISLTGIIWAGVNGRIESTEMKVQTIGNDMTKMMTHYEYIRAELQALRQMMERKP